MTHSVATTDSPKLKNQNLPKAPDSKSESDWVALIGLPILMPAVCSTQGPCQAQTKSPDAPPTAAP